jgi:3beta-hydroxy-delta5-steroid dehydrogenase/steroid delta-isomerase
MTEKEQASAATDNSWIPPSARRETATLKNCIVTGGAGFMGGALAESLLEKGCNVRVLDVKPPAYSHENLEFFKCDISSFDDLEKHFAGIDTVFHAAAIIDIRGGRNAAPEARKLSYSVNVEGGRNVLKAASKHGVKRVVATSSNNATFNDCPNPDMDSRTPYATKIYDLYTETKVIIEPEILKYSGTDGVLTSVIRPAGIYGPNKPGAPLNYMFKELLDKMAAGLLVSNMGTPQCVQDVSYIDNLTTAHISLAENLVPGSPCCGKPYFIVDDEKMSNFEFFRPVIEGLGYKFPKLWIPSWMVRNVFVFWQWLAWKFKSVPDAMLSPKALDKICQTHFSNTRDAYEDFGWRPTGTFEEYMEVMVPWAQEEMAKIKAEKKK